MGSHRGEEQHHPDSVPWSGGFVMLSPLPLHYVCAGGVGLPVFACVSDAGAGCFVASGLVAGGVGGAEVCGVF